VKIIVNMAEEYEDENEEFEKTYGISSELLEEIRNDLIGNEMTACEMDNYIMETIGCESVFDEIVPVFDNRSASYYLNDNSWLNIVFNSDYKEFEPGKLDEDGDAMFYG